MSHPTSVFPLLPDDQFLTYFDQRFPLPQNSSWTRVNPSSKMQSQVISTLRSRQLHLRQWTTPPELLPGGTGSATLPNAASIPTSSLSPAASNSMPSWALPLGLELASTARTSKLVSKPSKMPYVSWHKPWQLTQRKFSRLFLHSLERRAHAHCLFCSMSQNDLERTRFVKLASVQCY